MRLLLVCNPCAGHGNSGRRLPEIENLCRQLHLAVDTRVTERPGHATEIIEAEDLAAYDGIVAAGGDGTVFEAVNGIFRNPAGPAIPLGVLPIGTGNSFSRDLAHRTGHVHEALTSIASGNTRKVDVGRCLTGGRILHFLNILGVGFVSDVTATAAAIKSLGNVSYTIGVVYRTAFLENFPLRLQLDGKTVERDAVFLEISNSRYTADFLMAPEARIDDGLLDITVLGKITRRRLLRLFPTVFRGEHIRYDEVETFRARQIGVATEQSKILSPDGELVGTTPADVSCLYQAMDVFC
jgi:diacylglycerol kinase (ATP)